MELNEQLDVLPLNDSSVLILRTDKPVEGERACRSKRAVEEAMPD